MGGGGRGGPRRVVGLRGRPARPGGARPARGRSGSGAARAPPAGAPGAVPARGGLQGRARLLGCPRGRDGGARSAPRGRLPVPAARGARSAGAGGRGGAAARDRGPGLPRPDLDDGARLRLGEGGKVPDADLGGGARGLLRGGAAARSRGAALGDRRARGAGGRAVARRPGCGRGWAARVRRGGQHDLHLEAHLQRRGRAAPRRGGAGEGTARCGWPCRPARSGSSRWRRASARVGRCSAWRWRSCACSPCTW